jgi:hypothetical protein
MANLPLPFDLIYRYKSSEGIIGLNLLKVNLITNLHRDLIINSPELILIYAYFTKQRLQLKAESPLL